MSDLSQSRAVLGQTINYQIIGAETSPKLVFLHGVMGFGLNFHTVSKHYEAEYQVLTYDQRGHGRSFHPQTGYQTANYANDLRDILDQLGWNAITLVGHSMGGRNSIEFAHRFPDRVQRLVIVDIGPQMESSTGHSLASLIDEVPTPFATKREAKAFFEGPFLDKGKSPDERRALAQFLYANIGESNGQATWRFYEPGIRESITAGRAVDRWSEIEAFKMPTLWMRGELSKDLPRSVFDEILRRNPRIEGVEIASVGHWVHGEKPKEFMAALDQFFKQHPLT